MGSLAVESPPGGGGGVLPYISYPGIRGRDFEAPDFKRGIHFRGVF